MFVAERVETGEVAGWLWVSLNTNFLTGDSYANFRSLATAQDGPDTAAVAERLFATGIEYAQQRGVSEITGKVHVKNLPMRGIYRKFGFEAEPATQGPLTPIPPRVTTRRRLNGIHESSLAWLLCGDWGETEPPGHQEHQGIVGVFTAESAETFIIGSPCALCGELLTLAPW